MSDIKREALLTIAQRLKPAISPSNYCAELTHIKFDGEFASAFNDSLGITLRCESNLDACVPGEMLIKILNEFTHENLAIKPDPKGGGIVLSSGRSSRMRLVTLPHTKWPLRMPVVHEDDGMLLTAELINGIATCLAFVDDDSTQPGTMGVTIDVTDDNRAVVYSATAATMSRCITKQRIKLPGDSPVFLPTNFCRQIVATAKLYPKDDGYLHILPGDLLVVFGDLECQILQRVEHEVDTMPFHKQFKQDGDVKTIKNELVPIPDDWEGAFRRTLLVTDSKTDKHCSVEIIDSTLMITAESELGESSEVLKHQMESRLMAVRPIKINPKPVLAAAKQVTRMLWAQNLLVLSNDDGSFTHLIAYCS